MPDKEMTNVSMSNRMYVALRMFTDHPRQAMSSEDALMVDQRSFGSIFHRKWIEWNNGRQGFVVTSKGQLAMSLYETTNVIKDKASTFSHYIRTLKYFTKGNAA